MKRSTKKNKESNLRQLIDNYVATASATTFNYKQVSAAIDARTPAQQRDTAL